MSNILWKYGLNSYGGFIEAPADLMAARNALIEKIKSDPASLIGKLEPVEPSCKTIAGLFKQSVGL